MKDIFHLYQQGLECMLEKVAADDPLLVDLSLLKSRLLIATGNLQIYGANDPIENGNLLRTLRDLHRICLHYFHMDFEAWCAQCATEKLRTVQHDPLYPYIGNWQALQDGMLQQFLREKLAIQGIHIPTKREFPVEDFIQRYRTVPLHAYLLYSSQDPTIEPYLKKHWDALESLSKDVYDLYISAAQLTGHEDGHNAIDTSYIVRKTGFAAYSLLPGILFWDTQWNWDFVSLKEHADENSMTTIFRLLYEHLGKNPTIATVREVNTRIHGASRLSDVEMHLGQFSLSSPLSLMPEKEMGGATCRDAPSAVLVQTCTELINELERMPTSDGSRYQTLVGKILTACFSDEFCPFHLMPEKPTYHRTRRRDFIIENIGSGSEFWHFLKYKQNVELIVFDAKNYEKPLPNDKIASTLRYLVNKSFGNFMIFVTRHGLKDYTEVLENFGQEQKIALFLDDADVIAMLERKREGEQASSFIREKYVQFLSMT